MHGIHGYQQFHVLIFWNKIDQQIMEIQRTLQLILIVSVVNDRGVRIMDMMEFVGLQSPC